jgi:hypothetical protein
VLLLALFSKGRVMVTQVWSHPRLITYGVVIGLGAAIWITMGYFLGVSYVGAGARRGADRVRAQLINGNQLGFQRAPVVAS